jgi:hypothetical protein
VNLICHKLLMLLKLVFSVIFKDHTSLNYIFKMWLKSWAMIKLRLLYEKVFLTLFITIIED